jgi:hypothetical protein
VWHLIKEIQQLRELAFCSFHNVMEKSLFVVDVFGACQLNLRLTTIKQLYCTHLSEKTHLKTERLRVATSRIHVITQQEDQLEHPCEFFALLDFLAGGSRRDNILNKSS